MISPPPNQNEIQTSMGGRFSIAPMWQKFFSDIFDSIFALQSSGTTANRPTKNLFVSRTYFDTTLGIPIWWNGSSWKKADGTAA